MCKEEVLCIAGQWDVEVVEVEEADGKWWGGHGGGGDVAHEMEAWWSARGGE